MSPNIIKRIRNLASTVVILVLLAVVLCFYYLKYVPDRRSEFNRNAFRELSQIQNALQSRNQAFRDAIQNIIHQTKTDTEALLRFNYKPDSNIHFRADDRLGSTQFELDDSSRLWQVRYPVYTHKNRLNYTSIKTWTR